MNLISCSIKRCIFAASALRTAVRFSSIKWGLSKVETDLDAFNKRRDADPATEEHRELGRLIDRYHSSQTPSSASDVVQDNIASTPPARSSHR